MLEPTFGSLVFSHNKRKTRRERFLDRIDWLIAELGGQSPGVVVFVGAVHDQEGAAGDRPEPA